MALKDYYRMLGLAPTATQDEIKRTYRKLARKYHPDLNKATDAEAQFKEVAEAYKALNDVEKRAAYDAAIDQEKNANHPFSHPPEWGSRSDFNGNRTEDAGAFSRAAFFEDLFASRGQGGYSADSSQAGTDQYARIRSAGQAMSCLVALWHVQASPNPLARTTRYVLWRTDQNSKGAKDSAGRGHLPMPQTFAVLT